MFYIFFVVLKVKRALSAKSATQCPRVSYCDRDVLYGEFNYYLGCQPQNFTYIHDVTSVCREL